MAIIDAINSNTDDLLFTLPADLKKEYDEFFGAFKTNLKPVIAIHGRIA